MKRILSCFLIILLIFSAVLPCFADTDDSTIHIKSADDLISLSEKCTLDTWSLGKTVLLDCDIDLSGSDYRSIPVFSGTFDGQGHTIKNLKIDYSGSGLGLFRHIGRGGQVINLKVSGNISPDGIMEKIGGIAGQNSGTITSCSFSGNVSGGEIVGGIAGLNDQTGTITDCSVSGSITGKTKVGGIAGRNDGNIFTSSNSSEVNTVPIEFSASSVIGNVLDAKSVSDLNEISDTVKDIGGIVGYSAGVIRDSTNSGTVGYIHIGYNIGGIAGRHSGSIKGCENSGTIYGRRNTGGIVGQMEPYTSWVVSDNVLDSLRTELDSLQQMTNTLLDDVNIQSDALSAQLSDSIAQLDSAEESLDELITSTTDFVNGNIDAVNEVSVRVSDFIRGTESVTDELSVFLDELEIAVSDFSGFTDELKLSVDDGIMPAVDCLSDGMAILSDGMLDMRSSLEKLSAGFDSLNRSLGNPDAMYSAMQELAFSFTELSGAVSATERDLTSLIDSLYDDGTYYYDSFLEALRSNLSDLNYYLNNLSHTASSIADALGEAIASGELEPLRIAFEDFADNIKNSADSLHGALGSFEYLVSGMHAMLEDLKTGIPYISDDLSQLGTSLADISGGIGSVIAETDIRALSDALDEFSMAMEDMSSAFGNVSDSVNTINDGKEYVDTALSHISSAMGAASKASDSLTTAVASLNRASDAAGNLVSEFAAKEPVHFVELDDSFTAAQDSLFTALRGLSSSVNILIDTASSDILLNDLRALSDQIFKTFGVLIDLVDSVSDVSTDPESYQDDISSDNEKYSTSVICSSINRGYINSDYNAGGIAGNISIEISIDLENDLNLSGIFTSSVKHLIYAVIYDCESYADIEVKNNNAGGIVGSMDYGYVKSSVFGGTVSSTDGDYVGGIAGYSEGSIFDCMSRVNLHGKNYIGGIAGHGGSVDSSFAMISADNISERAGAIVGDSDGEITGNYFLENPTLGGIDGISYSGKAEPLSYDELFSKTNGNELFSETTVTFMCDGEVAAVVSVPFGGSIDTLPDIPDRDGMYWVWDSFNRDAIYSNTVVNGQYCAPLTTISSDEEIPMFLVEGKFYTNQTLTVSEWSPELASLGIEADGSYAAYRLSVSNYTDSLVVRMRHESAHGGTLYVIEDGTPIETSFKTDGSYIVFTMKNNSSLIFVDGHEVSHLAEIIIISASAAVLLCAACTVVILSKKRKRKKKSGAAAAIKKS